MSVLRARGEADESSRYRWFKFPPEPIVWTLAQDETVAGPLSTARPDTPEPTHQRAVGQ
jgi:hypothetical protein